MPFFDRKCGSCGTLKIDCLEPSEPPTVLCDDCGEPTERVWLSKSSNVIGDECDFVQHNGTKTPIRFRSRGDHKLWLKSHGYRIAEDASAKGSKSAGIMDAYTLEAARTLVSRDNRASGWRDPDQAPIGITSDEGVIRFLRDRSRADNFNEFGFSGR